MHHRLAEFEEAAVPMVDLDLALVGERKGEEAARHRVRRRDQRGIDAVIGDIEKTDLRRRPADRGGNGLQSILAAGEKRRDRDDRNGRPLDHRVGAQTCCQSASVPVLGGE